MTFLFYGPAVVNSLRNATQKPFTI